MKEIRVEISFCLSFETELYYVTLADLEFKM